MLRLVYWCAKSCDNCMESFLICRC